MDQQFKREWTAALRSGKYEQAQGRLCDLDGKHCCLGVAYRVQPDVIEIPYDYGTSFALTPPDADHLGGVAFLEDEMLARIGVVQFEADGETHTAEYEALWECAHSNDAGKTFAQIADYIDATF